ncbi:hypothetical protein ACFPYI_06880 [Halomarina salina]|uniref:DNA primase/polymerase bifunctional N-terminal domain-containing protein n=1 Tax=Halomarina salina TaxID=1872699 RepID=A0ABD5RL58_9EURY|nr:hypothetical protein [Halomarina salina]
MTETFDVLDERTEPIEPFDIEEGVYPSDWKEEDYWCVYAPGASWRPKAPRAPWLHPHNPMKGSQWSKDEAKVDFETAQMYAEQPQFGLEFVLPNRDDYDHNYVLIDFDKARNPETGEVHPTVLEYIERCDSFADISTSGTGIHIYARGDLPDDLRGAAVEAPLQPQLDEFPNAGIEVYEKSRACAMTGLHIVGTPESTQNAQEVLDEICEEYGTFRTPTPSEDREPSRSRAELGDIETTHDIQDVFDAAYHVRPSDIWLKSTVTNDRGGGTFDLDPSFAESESGTRLAQLEDGWIYRQGDVHLTATKLVALEEGLVSIVGEQPTGEAWWKTIEALRERGAHIPKYEKPAGADAHTEFCEPPEYDPLPVDVAEIRREMREEKMDDFLNGDRDVIWTHPPGTGKTTNAMLEALDQELAHSVLFDTHEKIDEMMETIIGEVCFGDHYFHLIGGQQPRERRCRKYKNAKEQCPHHPSRCPLMCPAYEDDEFCSVMGEVGPVQAHILLEPHGDDTCEWKKRLSKADNEDYVLGVKEHQQLKPIQKEFVIYDEAPKVPTGERNPPFNAQEVEKIAAQFELLSNSTPGRLAQYAGAFSEFARQAVDYMLRRDEKPVFPDVDSYDGALGMEPLDNPLTELVKLKQEFNARLIQQMKDGNWDGTPMGFDALMMYAGASGAFSGETARRVVAAEDHLRSCPRCHESASLSGAVGSRGCACGWAEDLTREARAIGTIPDPYDNSDRELIFEYLAATEDLPSKVLVLDATADIDIHRSFFGRTPGVVGDEQYEMDFDVTQLVDGEYPPGVVRGTGPYNAAAPRLQQVIKFDCAKHDRVLLVGHQKAQKLYDIPDNAEFIYYQGSTKAVNREDFDHVVILGSNHPPTDALHRQAYLLSLEVDDLSDGGVEHTTRNGDDVVAPEPSRYIFEDDEGKGRQVRSKYFTGLTGTLFEQKREREIEQAVHRLRPLLHPGKSATIVTNVPTRLPVTELSTIKEYTKQLAHQKLLGHFDEEFTIEQVVEEFDVSERTAREWISKCEDEGDIEQFDGFGGVHHYWYT